VIALEEEEALVRPARENLKAVGTDNVTVVAGPLTQGWQDAYDVIFLNGATEIAPDAVRRRLEEAAGSSASWAAPTGQAMLYRSLPATSADG